VFDVVYRNTSAHVYYQGHSIEIARLENVIAELEATHAEQILKLESKHSKKEAILHKKIEKLNDSIKTYGW
jgi:hypothetical protein